MHWSFYNPATGIFTGGRYGGPVNQLALNTPVGLAAMPGVHDFQSKRVVGGAVVDYQPPQPASTDEFTYAWSASLQRHVEVLTPLGVVRRQNAATLALIQADELASLRSMREIALALSGSTSSPAVAALQNTEAVVVARRAQLALEP